MEAKPEEAKQETTNEEPEVVKTTNEEIENTVEENDLISKDMTWDDLGVNEDIKKGLLEMGFMKPSKIQSTTYPLIMKNPPGHLIAQAKNGAGKTGAFGLGIVSKIDTSKDNIQAIVFAHTRELVLQITDVLSKIAKFTKIKITAIVPQVKITEYGHIVVSTPGSFETHFLKKKASLDQLKDVKCLVLDEADFMVTNEVTIRICDSTFKKFHDNKFSVQVLFFSATFTPENFKTIKKYFKKANMIELKKEELTLNNVRQLYFKTENRDKKVDFVEEYLKNSFEQERVIIFVNTKDFTVRLQQTLTKRGYKVYILMGGDMDPKNRDETIKRFNSGEIQILITTNVLARGYDEKLVKLVINFDIPVKHDNKTKTTVADVETYLHRIGRTGRFGAKGIGLTLITKDEENYLKQIEQHYGSKIEQINALDDLIKEFKEFLLINY